MVVPVRDLFTICCNMGLHPCDITDEETHHVKKCGCRGQSYPHHPRAMILLTTRINGLDRADFSIVKHLLDCMGRGEIDRLMCDSNLFSVSLSRSQQFYRRRRV